VPVNFPKYRLRTTYRKALAGKEIPQAVEGWVEVRKSSIRVVVRQHDFPKCYRLRSEGPPAYEEGSAEGEQQVYHAGLGAQAEGENRPGDERRESQQESGEHDVSPRWCVG
jgi:hypothetical protein